MKGKTLGYYTISDEDFEFIVTKPLFILRMFGSWILKVNVDPRGEVFTFFGLQSEGLVNASIPDTSSHS